MSFRVVVVTLALCFTADVGGTAWDWTTHASRPGPDYPAAGQSRFDDLYRQADGSYRIPYPFSALLADLEQRIDNGAQRGVRYVLVPHGRSLQRDAPAPDFFRFPREIIALEGEPKAAKGDMGSVLEYRLFVAHQPVTETLEIISYNDAAGRFEFQVVTDYRADREPRVAIANRILCLSCHQNAGPIFPRRPWSETSFNVAVASQLARHYPPANGSLVGLITTDAGLIDVLSEQANYLSAAQAVWQRGCASPACRAAALRAILQYRLSGGTGFDWSRDDFRRDYVAELRQNWDRQWPNGLALASSRLQDRDPFAQETMLSQDPLALRPPHAVWHEADDVLARGILQRLAGFFSAEDIRRLDQRLQALGADRAERRLSTTCRTRVDTAARIDLVCGSSNPRSLQAKLETILEDGKPIELRATRLRIPGDATLWQPRIGQPRRIPAGVEAGLRHADGKLSQRLRSGERLDSLRLKWQGRLERAATVTLELVLRDEFGVLDRVLAQLLHANRENRSDSLSDLPFRRVAILSDLMRGLKMPQPRWTASSLPAAPAVSQLLPAELTADLALLYPYCGSCHAATGLHPPGFLAPGDTLARVTDCAPRIWRRLESWRSGARQSRAPMPPPASLPSGGNDQHDWPLSEHYRSLLQAVENLLEQQEPRAEWRTKAYDSLPVCRGAG